ncbi:hypothetical protein ACA910_009276 [Epithemia clementina (nom. ined.)]
MSSTVVQAVGKGPRGLQVLSPDYVLVCEANLDALVVVDLSLGGMVGSIRLHDPKDDPTSLTQGQVPAVRVDDPQQSPQSQEADAAAASSVNYEQWRNPNYLATCVECDFVYVVGAHGTDSANHHIHKIQLPQTWKDMMAARDFSSLAKVNPSKDIIPVSTTTEAEPNLEAPQTIAMTQDGSVAYLVVPSSGIWKIEQPTQQQGSSENQGNLLQATQYMTLDDLEMEDTLEGSYLTPDDKYLVVTSHSTELVRIDLEAHQVVQKVLLSVDMGCVGENLDFETWVVTPDQNYGYVFFSNQDGEASDLNAGWALYKMALTMGGAGISGPETEDPTAEAALPHSYCEQIAGNDLDAPGWVDGSGLATRFSRPHSLQILEESEHKVRLVATDMDNRAVRVIETVPSLDNAGKPITTSTNVYTVDYNEGLWRHYYFPETELERLEKRIFSTTEDHSMFFLNVTDLPRSHHETITKATHRDMETACQKQHPNARLCQVTEIRNQLDDIYTALQGQDLEVWTDSNCNSCWLEQPGYCPTKQELIQARGPGDIDTTQNQDESFWGSSYYMAIKVHDHETHHSRYNQMQMQCLHQDTKLEHAETLSDVVGMCCIDIPEDTEKENWELAGLVAGLVVGMVACGLLVCYFYRRHRRHRRALLQQNGGDKNSLQNIYFDDDRMQKRWKKRQNRQDQLRNIHGGSYLADNDDSEYPHTTETEHSSSSSNSDFLTVDDFLELFVDEDLDRRAKKSLKQKFKCGSSRSSNSSNSVGSSAGKNLGGLGRLSRLQRREQKQQSLKFQQEQQQEAELHSVATTDDVHSNDLHSLLHSRNASESTVPPPPPTPEPNVMPTSGVVVAAASSSNTMTMASHAEEDEDDRAPPGLHQALV